jgi:Fe-S-cluster-containing hydrogenase component 2
MAIKFDIASCDKNPYCPVIKVCPTGAMFIDRKTFRPTFDPEKCTGCGTCVPFCPHGALSEE